MREQLAFQLEDGGSTPTPPLQFWVDIFPYGEARQFVKAWHYSHRMPTGKNVCFGVWSNAGLYAAIIYGTGVNPYQAAFLGAESVVEIKRLCRREPKQDYHLSKFIRFSLKMLRSYMSYDAVVAFADPEEGHLGTVYEAAGFSHHGMSNTEWHLIDKDGVKRHRRYAYRFARRNGIPLAQARDQLSVTRSVAAPKHRWVLRISSAAAHNDERKSDA